MSNVPANGQHPSEPPLGSAVLRWIGAVGGAAAYCVLARDWKNAWDVLYDVPAALSVFGFFAQLLAEGIDNRRSARWWVRPSAVIAALAIVAATVIWQDRLMAGHVSGHMTMVLLVAIIQSADGRLPPWLRAGHWIPVPIVAAMRVFILHGRIEVGLVGGVLVGGALGLGAVLLMGQQTRSARRRKASES